MINFELKILPKNWSLIFILFFAFFSGYAQQVRVTTQVLPPYSQYISDYQSRAGQIVITLLNTSRSSFQVQLVGSIIGDNGVSISTVDGYRSPSAITVGPGATVRVSPADIRQLFDDASLNFTGIDPNDILRKNTLPEGTYQICVQALDYSTLRPLSLGEPQGCSAPFPLQSLEPPIFIRPTDDEVITAPIGAPQNIIFTWTTPASAPPSTRYRLKIFEHFNPDRNPNDIVRAAGLALFDRDITGNTFIYGPGQPLLQRGRKYIAILQAFNPTGRSVYRNEGFSEPLVFQYGVELVPVSNSSNGTNTGGGSETDIASNLPSTKIKGQIFWDFVRDPNQPKYVSFGKITSNKNMAESMKYIMDVNYNGISDKEHTSAAASNWGKLTNSNIGANIGGFGSFAAKPDDSKGKNSYLILGGLNMFEGEFAKGLLTEVNPVITQPAPAKYPLIKEKVYLYALKTGTFYQPNLVSTATVIDYLGTGKNSSAQKSGNFTTSLPNSLPKSSQIGAINSNVFTTVKVLELGDKVLVGTATTDETGAFELEMLNPTLFSTGYDRLALEIKGKDFVHKAVTKPLVFNALNGNFPDINFGTVNAEALNYTFKPILLNEDNEPIKDIDIKLYRKANFYDNRPNHTKEGSIADKSKTETIEGIDGPAVLVAKGRSTQSLYSLFFNHTYAERYYMVINGEGYIPVVTDLQVQRSGYDIEVPTITKTLKLERSLPTVKGVVSLLKDGVSTPIPGATVTIYFDDKWKQAMNPPTTNGNFSNKKAQSTINKNTSTTVSTNQPKTNQELSGYNFNSNFNAKGLGANSGAEIVNYFPMLMSSGNQVMLGALLNGDQISTTSDQNGAYIFKNIPVNKTKDAYYYIVTKAPNITKPKLDSVICDKRGLPDRVLNITFNPVMISVTGRTVDKQGNPIPEPIVKWKSDGRTTSGGSNGIFLTMNSEGKDSLIINKFGYAEKRIAVTVKKATGGVVSGGNISTQGPLNFWSGLTATSTYKKAGGIGGPEVFGNYGNKNLTLLGNESAKKESDGSLNYYPITYIGSMYLGYLGNTEQTGGTMDLGDIVLEKRVGKIRFIVKDASTNTAVAGVKIQLPDFETEGVTNASGQWYIEGPSGNVLASVIPVATTGYMAKEITVLTADDGVVETIITLEKGVKITGRVTAAGSNIANANITVDGREFISTKSAADGTYSLVVPVGEFTIKGSKSGYLGVNVTRSFVLGSPQTVDLALGDSGGKDLTKMLGFDIELEQMTGNILSGYFINFKPMGPFKALAGKKLKFTNVNVTWDAQNRPVPNGNQVVSNDTQLDFKAFDFLPLRVTKPGGLIIKKDVANKGVVQGLIEISVDQMLGNAGINFPADFKPNLTTASASTPTDLSVFTEDGSFPYGAEFFLGTALAMAGDKFEDSKLKIKLYNFEARIDLGKCSLKSDGLHLVGGVKTTGIPLLGDRLFNFKKFHIGTDFGIKAVEVDVTPAPTLTIVTWSATLNSFGFNENGFKIGGNMKFKLPSSKESNVSFSNLKFGLGTVFGGSFTLPAEGVNVFNIVDFKPGSVPLSFGQLGSSGVYYIAGSGKFTLPRPIDKTLNIKAFQIQTDLKFAATVEANLKVDFLSVAKLDIIDIGFSTLGAQPEINVNGAFQLQIPFFKATVGGIHFRPSGVTVDELGAGFDIVGVAKVEIRVKMVDTPQKQGFAGAGALAITGTPINAKMAFHYYKIPGGVDVGAEFEAGVVIPIGLVTIEKIGGGFSLNTAQNKFYVKISGAASFTGTGPLIKLDPIMVEVWSGPVIKGTMGIVVGSALQAANAQVVVDVPQSYFAINIDVNMSPLPDLITARAQGDFILSAKPNDKYFFFGVGYRVNLLGLVDANGGLALGANLQNAKSHERASFYLQDVPGAYMSGTTFNGIYIYASTSMGVDKNNAWGFDAGIASAKAWLYNSSKFHFIANFSNGAFQIRSRLKFGGGAEACVVGLCAGVGLDACLDLAGGRNPTDGWNFDGYAQGSGSLSAGCDSGCNSIGWLCDCCCPIPCGFKICVAANLRVTYKSKPGDLDLNFGLGGSGNCAGF